MVYCLQLPRSVDLTFSLQGLPDSEPRKVQLSLEYQSVICIPLISCRIAYPRSHRHWHSVMLEKPVDPRIGEVSFSVPQQRWLSLGRDRIQFVAVSYNVNPKKPP